ncbi:hypothetical protein W97_01116 [Coniosporium apollinis CBS 100218]|uniref:Uncharacterized protein n=1 Tax=Coniosporium apollinis (strain CBS 100218) TaxID=1168221 RepID=R7YJ35_CONA1|nr:uncharacterized protein W97_01116 [Coniosporium apollinis CBS 100218]EON61898.1 hypothetical protein W97_01116 [Coniosporium apollinis CBS 100218]
MDTTVLRATQQEQLSHPWHFTSFETGRSDIPATKTLHQDHDYEPSPAVLRFPKVLSKFPYTFVDTEQGVIKFINKLVELGMDNTQATAKWSAIATLQASDQILELRRREFNPAYKPKTFADLNRPHSVAARMPVAAMQASKKILGFDRRAQNPAYKPKISSHLNWPNSVAPLVLALDLDCEGVRESSEHG